MPSLHSAFALFVVAFFVPRVRRRWRPLLLAYPLVMTFTLVYTGEHYLTDVLVGWLYVGLSYGVVAGFERWWAPFSRARAARAAVASVAASA
jgi:membrane-associated phospholipid phosphatase